MRYGEASKQSDYTRLIWVSKMDTMTDLSWSGCEKHGYTSSFCPYCDREDVEQLSLFREIESSRFYIRQNMASTASGFVEGIKGSEEYKKLILQVPIARINVRALTSCVRPSDPSYENPLDVAIATYMLALNQLKVPTKTLKGLVIFLPNLWWPKRILEQDL